MEIKRKETKEL